MACFLAPVTEAVIVTAVEKKMEGKADVNAVSESEGGIVKIPLSRKLKWLNRMLWGGAFLLAFEHVWHGEVTAWFPFLTAMSNAEDTAEMLKEIGTNGVCMAALITAVWAGICRVADSIINRKTDEETEGANA
ncbi:MAG: hypothetical protein K6E63_03590 [Lachnospiraceae bacterium]|nr:hypothetical protein [Lachnospiraceae bacterium]